MCSIQPELAFYNSYVLIIKLCCRFTVLTEGLCDVLRMFAEKEILIRSSFFAVKKIYIASKFSLHRGRNKQIEAQIE